MDINYDIIKRIVTQPQEGLSVELKRWLDPAEPSSKATIVRALMALRNFNGGYLAIGFDDSGRPLPGVPNNVHDRYHPDVIQKLVSAYSSDPFEVAVEFVERDGQLHPVMQVSPGVMVPVAIKDNLKAGDHFLLKYGEVPFRTLRTNGSFSSAAAHPRDWKDIVSICFENREADVGRFIRRQLSGLNPEILALLGTSLSAANASPDEALRAKAVEQLDAGSRRYALLMAERGIDAGPEEAVKSWGIWEATLVIDPPNLDGAPSQEFHAALTNSNPRFTAWPIWSNSQGLPTPYAGARVREGAWEALLFSIGAPSPPLDIVGFTRLDPRGVFYELRGLEDDGFARVRGARVKSAFDPGLTVLNVAEALLVGLRYARGYGGLEPSMLAFAFRWTGLQGRAIATWKSQLPVIPNIYHSSDDGVTTSIVLPPDTADNAIAPFVQRAVNPVFAMFDGYQMGLNVVESLVRMVIERRVT